MKACATLAWLAFQQNHAKPLFARAFITTTTTTTARSVTARPSKSGPFLAIRSDAAPSTTTRTTRTNTRCNMSSKTTAGAAESSASSPDATDDVTVAENLRLVREALQAARQKSPDPTAPVRLVAVSKTKPIELLLRAYQEGDCRIFGENYVQELVDKVPQMPDDVQWHYIGALQSNKVNKLLRPFLPDQCHRLVLETVSSEKLALKLHNAMSSTNAESDGAAAAQSLSVFVQVNTSGEDSKSGVEPGEELVNLCKTIIEECPTLKLQGLMTIGAVGDTSCFQTLVECRTSVAEALQVDASCLELSMGMSADFEQAIEYGATNVRVGSTIFGARNYASNA